MTPTTRMFLAPVAAFATLGLGGAGTLAATSPPDDSVAPDAVSSAGEQSSTAPYRLEVFMAMSMMGIDIDGDTPLATGEVDGERTHMMMDFGPIFAEVAPADEMPPELRDVEMVMEVVTDGSDFYFRAPLFAAIADQGGDPTTQVFAQLGDGWGYVDGSAVPGMDPGALSSTMGVGGIDPGAMFDLLSTVEGAEAIGTTEIRGVSVSGVRTEVDLADLMEAQGTPLPATATSGSFADATFPIEVWIDTDGFVRRMVMDLNGEAIAEASGEDIPAGTLGDMNVSMTMDMFDYNAADIAIEIPTEFVDITDRLAEMTPSG